MAVELTPTSDSHKVITQPRIIVIGVGGGGTNAVNNMISSDLKGVDFIVANTDAQHLESAKASTRIQLGPKLTQGLGAGSKPEVGRKSAEEVEDEIRKYLEDVDLVFVTTGMGGGTGTGATPVIARLAKESGALTIGVVSKPFTYEGKRRSKIASEGIAELEEFVDTLIVIPNQNLFTCSTQDTTVLEALGMADKVLTRGVKSVTDLMVNKGHFNLDFADVKTVMGQMGKAMMGTYRLEKDDPVEDGASRAIKAAEEAMSNPLLEEDSIKGARGLLVNVTAGPDLSLHDYTAINERINQEAHPDVEFKSGLVCDPDMEGIIEVSVVATGIDKDRDGEHNNTPSQSHQEDQSQQQILKTPSKIVEKEVPSSQEAPEPEKETISQQEDSVTPTVENEDPTPEKQPEESNQTPNYTLNSPVSSSIEEDQEEPDPYHSYTPQEPLSTPKRPQKKRGFFSRLFGGSSEEPDYEDDFSHDFDHNNDSDVQDDLNELPSYLRKKK